MSRHELYAHRYPLLPLKNVVIFPRNIVTLLVGRPRSIQAVEEALSGNHRLVVTAHRDADAEDPSPDDLYSIGSLVDLVSVERQPSNAIQVVLEGKSRVRVSQFDTVRPYFTIAAEELREPKNDSPDTRALMHHVQELAGRYNDAREKMAPEILEMVQRASDPGHLADLLATQIVSETSRRQHFLEQVDPIKRLEEIAVHLAEDLNVAELESRIQDRVREQVEKQQREYYLTQQLKAIHDELSGEGGNELDGFRQKIKTCGMPAEIEDKMLREVGRLERMPSVSAEATVVRTYLDVMLALPWSEQSVDRLDLDEAEVLLNEDHFGLEQVKDRILDFLAVRKLRTDSGMNDRASSQILCLAGPPGVGKTSLGRSIADLDGAQVRACQPGWRARRGRDPRTSPYVYRRNAGPHHHRDEPGRNDQSGYPCSTRSTNSPPITGAIRPPRCWKCSTRAKRTLHRSLPRRTRTTSRRCSSLRRPTICSRSLVRCATGWRSSRYRAIPRMRRSRSASATSCHSNSRPTALKEAHVDSRARLEHLVREYTREAGVRELEREIAAICRKAARERWWRVPGTIDDGADRPLHVSSTISDRVICSVVHESAQVTSVWQWDLAPRRLVAN